MNRQKTESPDYGDLCDYETGDTIRPAIVEELIQSLDGDNGTGTFALAGRTCYVEWKAPTTACITALRTEAAARCDPALVEDCNEALAGDGAAIVRCASVLDAAWTAGS